ncbi:hypothetical protein M529_16800 [Sphingobium ummariense RL-3]|uniref:Uncharacterized protein n=1 Tax=Sphingobium ummariense RL-3 TaxID=1346791 RepID=T0KBS5_9SPHN|nr:hypothetical protein M529_16800 [Sphingobium ummariense RL-3]
MLGASFILPWQGRWQAEGLTEGYFAIVSGTPLHHYLVLLPLRGRNFGNSAPGMAHA